MLDARADPNQRDPEYQADPLLLMHIESYAISEKDGLKGAAPQGPMVNNLLETIFDRCDFRVSLLYLPTTGILLLIAHGTGHRLVVVCAKCQCPLDSAKRAPSLELETLIFVKQ